jgi:hypothetical protein
VLASVVALASSGGCSVDAVVGVAGPSDAAANDALHLAVPGDSKDSSPDGPQFLAGPDSMDCKDSAGCPTGAYCWTGTGCPTAKSPGACAYVPATCGDEHEPVCGCDGKSYANSCLAHQAGTSVRQAGDCP